MKRLLVICLLPLIFAGCGGSSGDSDEDQIRSVITASADAMADEEVGNYCELLSPAALEEIESTEGLESADCEGVMLIAVGMVSDSDIETMRDPQSIEISGDTASISYEDAEFDGATMERVDGEWMIGPNE